MYNLRWKKEIGSEFSESAPKTMTNEQENLFRDDNDF